MCMNINRIKYAMQADKVCCLDCSQVVHFIPCVIRNRYFLPWRRSRAHDNDGWIMSPRSRGRRGRGIYMGEGDGTAGWWDAVGGYMAVTCRLTRRQCEQDASFS